MLAPHGFRRFANLARHPHATPCHSPAPLLQLRENEMNHDAVIFGGESGIPQAWTWKLEG